MHAGVEGVHGYSLLTLKEVATMVWLAEDRLSKFVHSERRDFKSCRLLTNRNTPAWTDSRDDGTNTSLDNNYKTLLPETARGANFVSRAWAAQKPCEATLRGQARRRLELALLLEVADRYSTGVIKLTLFS